VHEYRTLKRQIDETVGRINGRFSDQRWTPIRYLARSLSPPDLAALYRRGDIALVTPLRDGMNVVAKEYVASRVDEDGVLILSELAGAAQELQEALLVNPFDVHATADALAQALAMTPEERRLRMAALRDRVRANSVDVWVTRFLSSAERAVERARTVVRSPPDALFDRLRPWLAERPLIALFLDYDGTLTPIVDRPQDAQLSGVTRDVLRLASQVPALDVTIVSGRSLADVRDLVGVPGLTYVGNHGFEIEGPGISHRPPGLERHAENLQRAAHALDALDIPGTLVEHKGASLSFHLRGVEEAERAGVQRRAERVLSRWKLRVTQGKAVVEGRPPIDWGKGRAVLHVLTQRHGVQWPSRVRAIYVGDDTTDYDAFRSLRGIGRSIFVGTAPTSGQEVDHVLPDSTAVSHLLRRLTAGDFGEPS
jgi:trehalose 6-phosphate synthase/phosphatase